MFWLQAGMSFAIWMTYGLVQWRRSARLRARVLRVRPSRRGTYGTLLIIGGAAVLLAGLLLVQAYDGLSEERITPWAWVLITALGLIFVHAQTIGAALMVTSGAMRVTDADSPTSATKESPDQHD